MPGVVLGLLGGHMIFIVTAITLGTGDPSFAVVPEYYQKAVDYDEHKARLAESAALGWLVEIDAGDTLDPAGERDVHFRLRDRNGRAITGASVRVSAYHNARAAEPIDFACVEALPGQYVAKARLLREGFWRFAIEVECGDERFVTDLKQFVSEPRRAR